MGKTIVGIYDGPDTADRVISELTDSGFSAREIRAVHANDFEEREPLETDILGVSGMAKPEVGKFEEAVRRGGSLVSVTCEDDRANSAELLMQQHNPIDLEELAAQWKIAGWNNPYDAVADQDVGSRHEDSEAQLGRDRGKFGVRVFVW